MSEREIDQEHADTPGRSIVLTRHQLAWIIVVGYAVMATIAWRFVVYLARAQELTDDSRYQQAPIIFAVVMGLLSIKALVNLYRPVRAFPDER